VHHLHLWSISSGIHSLSTHVQIEDQLTSDSDKLLHEINDVLRSRFGIIHSTLQIECEQCAGCVCRLEEGHGHERPRGTPAGEEPAAGAGAASRKKQLDNREKKI
jgi:hypothetical protein